MKVNKVKIESDGGQGATILGLSGWDLWGETYDLKPEHNEDTGHEYLGRTL